MSTPLLSLLSFFIILPSFHFVRADCECGYTVDSALYTDLIETDFLHLANITGDADWQPQNYTVTAGLARGLYGKHALVSNVVANPLKSQYDWAGNGVSGGDAGLQLFVRGGIPQDGLIPIAEVATARADLFYGSFRAGMKVTGTPGTCGAFFWVNSTSLIPSCHLFSHLLSQYFNDTQEIDMEFLSAEFNDTSKPVNLVLQSPESAKAGFNAANTATFQIHQLNFTPSEGFHEYRFDWSPNAVEFYADGVLLDTMTSAIPTAPGHITLSHWSNGDPNWSAGPPTEDAILTVEYFKGYFNSSDQARQHDWSKRCTNPSATNVTCPVPEITQAPDGNASARTFFFSMQPDDTDNQTVFGSKKKSEGISLEIPRAGTTALTLMLTLSSVAWILL